MKLQDRDGIEAIYRQHITLVRRQALRIVGDAAAAEDVAQEVFLKFFQVHARGPLPERLSGYLFRMATNMALNHLRKHKRYKVTQGMDENAPAEDTQALVRESLAFCDPTVAHVAACHFLSNQRQQEIADELGVSRHIVRQHLETFVQTLRKGWRQT